MLKFRNNSSENKENSLDFISRFSNSGTKLTKNNRFMKKTGIFCLKSAVLGPLVSPFLLAS
jgi:hypothetical protein